jgi:hypothetical protein
MSLVKKYQHYYNKFIQNAFKISFTVSPFTNHESRGLQVFCRTHFNLVNIILIKMKNNNNNILVYLEIEKFTSGKEI